MFRRRRRESPPGRRTLSERAVRRCRRFLAVAFIALVFVVAVVIAVTIATSTSSTAVQFKRVVANDVHTALNDIHNFINQFTK